MRTLCTWSLAVKCTLQCQAKLQQLNPQKAIKHAFNTITLVAVITCLFIAIINHIWVEIANFPCLLCWPLVLYHIHTQRWDNGILLLQFESFAGLYAWHTFGCIVKCKLNFNIPEWKAQHNSLKTQNVTNCYICVRHKIFPLLFTLWNVHIQHYLYLKGAFIYLFGGLFNACVQCSKNTSIHLCSRLPQHCCAHWVNTGHILGMSLSPPFNVQVEMEVSERKQRCWLFPHSAALWLG